MLTGHVTFFKNVTLLFISRFDSPFGPLCDGARLDNRRSTTAVQLVVILLPSCTILGDGGCGSTCGENLLCGCDLDRRCDLCRTRGRNGCRDLSHAGTMTVVGIAVAAIVVLVRSGAFFPLTRRSFMCFCFH